tara:strand:- start:1771 stop:2766 length:996 start_codon:yes stop_codon:yes gene_type:complete
MQRIAVIGAGLAGLTFSNQLSSQAEITVFDKSRGVGGRLATRRSLPFHFDHGAQFIKADREPFKALMYSLKSQGVVEAWHARFAELKESQIISNRVWSDAFPHYVGVPSMNSMAKALAEPLNLKLCSQIDRLEKQGSQWQLYDTAGLALGLFDWVVLALPAPQALSLYPALKAINDLTNLHSMTGCYALMIGLDSPLSLPFDVAFVRDSCINLISVNSSKPGRDKEYSLVIHADNKWSQMHIDDDQNFVTQCLLEEAGKQLASDLSKTRHTALHRWRYANQVKQTGPKYYLNSEAKIAACGDWFIQGKAESAFISGLNLSQNMLTHLKGMQ